MARVTLSREATGLVTDSSFGKAVVNASIRSRAAVRTFYMRHAVAWMLDAHLAATLRQRASQGKMRPMRRGVESIFRFSALFALPTLAIILVSAHVTLKLPIITWVCAAGPE